METGKPQKKFDFPQKILDQLKHKELLTRTVLDTKLLEAHLFEEEQYNKMIIKLTI